MRGSFSSITLSRGMMMDNIASFFLPLVLLLLASSIPSSTPETVTVSVKSARTISRTDDTFVCATLDWWPPTKCDYGMCPWGNSSLFNLDLENRILINAIKAFKNLRIRLGGSLQDQLLYGVGTSSTNCGDNFHLELSGLFGFSEGCLSMSRWDNLNSLFSSTGAILSFGLNALSGRKKAAIIGNLYVGSWDPYNAREFINYTVSKGYKIENWEFGNELSGKGIAARVEAKQYGEDLIVLKEINDQVYKNSSIPQAKILAPGGFFDAKWFAEMLRTSGPDVLNVVTHHMYNLGPGSDPNLPSHIMVGSNLDNAIGTYRDLMKTIKHFGPWTSAWVGESGGAFNSGGRVASHTFVSSFWYIDQLGMTSTFGHKVFCRQTLTGGNYGLLNATSFVPNPDYYSALLWHRLMGSGVLNTTHNGTLDLRAYAHCSRGQPGITLLLINLSNLTLYKVSVADNLHLYQPQNTSLDVTEGQEQREEYHLTAKDGNILSEVMLLNGKPLKLTSKGDIPELNPNMVPLSTPLSVSPHSIVFVRIKGFSAPACRTDSREVDALSKGIATSGTRVSGPKFSYLLFNLFVVIVVVLGYANIGCKLFDLDNL